MNTAQTVQKPPYLMIAILFVGAFVAFLNNTLLNVALPTMMEDLGVTYSTIQWLATGYMLVSGVLIPASAFLITRFKTRPLFIFAMAIFTIGTLFAAIAPNFGMLLAGRMIQAVGSSVMGPILMNVMLISFPVEKRGAAMGIFGLVMISAPAIGPTLSGWIVEHYDWRVLFEMILPIAIISLLLGIWKLQNVLPNRKVTLDYFSLVLSSIGFGGILYGFSTAGNDGWTDPIVLTTTIVGVIGVVAFVVRQLKLETPVLSMEIFKSPMFALSAVISAVNSMAMMGGMILTPAYVQQVRGIDPFESGLMMLPGAIVMAVMSPITGKLFDKYGPRILAVIGLFITAVATFYLSTLDVNSTYLFIISIYTIRMIGISLIMMPIMTNGLNSLPMQLNPHGTAANNTIQQVAGSIGTAILIAVMNARTTSSAETLAKEAQNSATGPMTEEQIATLKGQITQQALLDGIQYSFLIATFITLIPLILSFFLKRAKSPDKLQSSVENEAQ
ncbi:DHA2 family efflux MFS transporter permease subunit [Lysinibacillus antri]|uniref:DHA2 family efflux MFS transporter permease subunit n=1 Tax=Lysinibacillus antri TaxID=2498145 RepID=A0A432LB29_9BACI|nr:DHA2 family efflux MFS transporter permease subunit [Lysinibacillus antri]RUL51750.1 DHA2 family efflux MFS transporter permease subunit [Lysinibacillus antri]